eukprot:106401_1
MSTQAELEQLQASDEQKEEAVSPSDEFTDEIMSLYPDAVRLGMRLRIEQVYAIDTVAQTYCIRFVQVTDWEATEEDKQNYDRDRENYEPSTIIKPLWVNAVEFGSDYAVYSLFEHSDGKYYNLRMVYLDGKFTEEFECQNFPFDVQDLSFVFDCDVGINLVVLVPSRYSEELLYINRTYLALCDWDIVFHDVSLRYIDWKYLKTGKPADVRAVGRNTADLITSTMTFRIQVQRKSYAFCMRVGFWMFLFAVMGFYIFGFTATNLSDRLAFSIGLIFAIVAFQFIIADQLPNLPYLTIVDKYNLAVFMFILTISFESVLVGWKEEGLFGDNSETYDYYFLIALVIAFIVYHVGFAIYIMKRRQFENSKIGTKIDEEPGLSEFSLSVFKSKDLYQVPFGINQKHT